MSLFFFVVSVVSGINLLLHLFVQPVIVDVIFMPSTHHQFSPKFPAQVVVRGFVKLERCDVLKVLEHLRRETFAKLLHRCVYFLFLDSLILQFLIFASETLPREIPF